MSGTVTLKPGTYQATWRAYKMCCCLGPGLLRAIEFLGVGHRHGHYFKIPLGDSNVQPG